MFGFSLTSSYLCPHKNEAAYMLMEELYTYQELLFHALFASVATLAFAASFYLLLRRSNAIAPDINAPLRLRRWTAAFFAAVGAGHLWWLFIYYNPHDGDVFERILLCTAFDSVSSAPALLCTLLVSLQDRRRPLWPIAVASALTLIYLLVIYILDIRTTAFLAPPLLLVSFIFCFVLARAVRQYHRWLLDNYADLEHKEVRTIIVGMVAFVLTSASYSLANDYILFAILIEVANVLLIALLLWRVETLQTLEQPAEEAADAEDTDADPIYAKMQSLLQLHCIDNQFYLHHDASLSQLAIILNTNTSYLSQHFKQQGLTYNTYINSLRIRHFIALYQKAARTQHTVIASDLAIKCGFKNYNTFSTAFKHFTGQTVTEWVNDQDSRFLR